MPKTFPARLKELRMPDRKILDATLDHPVYYDASYSCAVNSYALRMSGITRGNTRIRRRREHGFFGTRRGSRPELSPEEPQRC